jgi:hypothetical protein
MHRRLIEAVLIAGLALGTAGSPWAQQPSRTKTAAPALQYDPNLDANDQLAPSQVAQPMPAAVPTPTGHTTAHAVRHAASEVPAAPREATRKQPRPAIFRAVACSGPFAKDSNNLKLAVLFDSKNVTFTDIDFNGTKVGASILFPKDPKRHLEIWWSNSANRSGTYLILINGQSTWGAPGGMRLGLTLAELEKLNHKPFKLKGFDKDKGNAATVSDWDGGALATLAGACKSGVSLQADPKAPADAVTALPADHEYSSSDPALRAVNPTVSEILLGY